MINICIFFVFMFFFRFEAKTEIFSNLNCDVRHFENGKASQVRQWFKVDKETGGFNSILISLFNPTDKDVVCDFILNRNNRKKPILKKRIILRRKTSRFNLKKIDFSTVEVKGLDVFYFRLISMKHPFYFNKSVNRSNSKLFVNFIDKKKSDKLLLFGIYNQWKSSILSFILKHNDAGKSKAGMVLIFLAFLVLFFGEYLLVKWNRNCKQNMENIGEDGKKIGILIIICFGFFLFLLISVSFLCANNTYSKLMAEDDAYITYKYAKNISQGRGFRFNPDEKVMGTTTPLYAMILSFFGIFTGNLPLVSLIINLTAILFSGLLTYLIMARYFSPYSALAGGMIVVFFPMFYRVIGMETNLLIFLLILTLYLFDSGQTGLSFVIAGLATLTRTEAVILFPILMMFLLVNKKYRAILCGAGTYLLTILPWFIFAFFYFGNVLPNTFYIKTDVYATGGGILDKIFASITAVLKLEFLKSDFLSGFNSYLPKYIQFYEVWMMLVILAFLISLRYLFKTGFFQLYLYWVLLYILGFSLLRAKLFIWYFVLALSVIPLFISLGLHRVYRFSRKYLGGNKALILLALLVFSLGIFEARGALEIFYGQWYHRHITNLERYETYRDIADYINCHIPGEKSIGMEEIGVLGHSIPNKIWDFYLLIHKAEQFPRLRTPATNEQWIPYLLTLMDPDFLILNSVRLYRHIAYQNYEEVKRFPVRAFNSNPFFYYSLMKKKNHHFNVLGGLRLEDICPKNVLFSGWAFGSERIECVELRYNNRVISTTDTFHKTSEKYLELFGFNRYIKNIHFFFNLPKSELGEGNMHDLACWARSENKKALVWKGRLDLSKQKPNKKIL